MVIATAPSNVLVPLYRQVSEQLLKAIMGGEFAPGEALPTESELCARFGVSRITVRKALDELVERQLIIRRRGVGTFVRQSDQGTWSVTLTGLLEEVLSPNRLVVVREAVVRPPADVLEFAQLPTDTRLKLFEGTNHVADGAPLVHLHYFFPLPIGERLSAEALSGPTQPIRLVEQALGVQVDHAAQIIKPMIASLGIARHLRIAAGTAVLRAIRVYYDAQQRPIEIFDAAYHPENYRYAATLYPRAGGVSQSWVAHS
jgi:GntR family transcriptional regulator